MKNIVKTIIIFFTLLALSSCGTKNFISTQPVKENTILEPGSLLYSLPQTIIKVQITITKHTFIAGPYAQYAEKYLGISGVQTSDNIYYTIDDVNMSTYYEADPKNVFALEFSDKPYDLTGLLQLSKQGMICLSPFTTDTVLRKSIFYDNNYKEQINFFDLSVKRNLEIGKDTLYKVVFRDSAFIKTPIIRKMLVEKEPEKKAKEAANFIIKTRKRRFKMVSGQYDFLPKDEGILATSINELNKVENEYMELFIGKSYEDTHNLYFDITPQETKLKEGEKILLFRFSESEGIKPLNANAKAFVLEIEPSENYMPQQVNKTDNKNPVFYYRTPNTSSIRIFYDNKLIATKKQAIYQYGTLNSIPVKVFP